MTNSNPATRSVPAGEVGESVVRPGLPQWKEAARPPLRDRVKAWASRWRRPLTAVGILLAGIAGLAGLIATKPETQREAKAERVWTVDAAEATRADHRPDITLMGTVQPGRSLALRASVGGTVVESSPSLKEGGLVRAGETLLRIEPLDYELALTERRAQLDEARARLDELRANVQVRLREANRSAELFRRGTIPAPRNDEAQNALNAEQARVRAQEAVITRIQAAVTAAETDLARTRLSAPFDAFVGNVTAETGMRIAPQERVAELVGAEGMEARITLPTAAYGRLVQDGEVLVGRAAEVVWRLGDRTLTFPATVVRVDDRIETAAGGVGIFVRLEGNHLDTALRPGAFVEVRVPDRLYTNVVRLPPTALHGDDTVYVIADGRLEARKVAVVATKSNAVFLGAGLTGGEQVVTTRFQEIGPGVKVSVRGAPAADAKAADAKAADANTAKTENGQ